MIVAEYRNMPWSEPSHMRVFEPGVTVADIVASFDRPAEFERFGAVMFKRVGQRESDIVLREVWHLVRPRDDTALFISLVPQGGDGGGKDFFRIVAAIALIALTAVISGGGLLAMAPSLFGASFAAGGTGAVVTAAAVGMGGSMLLNMLTRPKAGTPAAGADDVSTGRDIGRAGVAQNAIAAWQSVPWPAGLQRVSPPYLARPFTMLENGDQVLYLVGGVQGPCSIDALKLNETDEADLADGVLEYETREGWPDDAPLSLMSISGFEESINLPMSTHRLESDQQTLIKPYAASYPKPHVFKSARRADSFRITLNVAGGLSNYNNENEVVVAFRLRLWRDGETKRSLPELQIHAYRREGFRQEIWLQFGPSADEAALNTGALPASRLFKRLYFKNAEWEADAYFDPGGGGAINPSPRHVYPSADGVTVFLDTAEFPKGRYNVEIARSFADAPGNSTETSYVGGMFTKRSTSAAGVESILLQSGFVHSVAIESYTTFRNEYPIRVRGMALIGAKIRNTQVNSLSAMFGPYCNIWNGEDWDDVAVTSNPGALLRRTWLDKTLNRRAVTPARLDALPAFYEHCVAKDLTCKHLFSNASVQQACDLIAVCGDGMVRRSDKWGVVIDCDRSEEPIAGLYSPANMTKALTITKVFVTGARGIVPHFRDEDRDFEERDLDRVIYDENVPRGRDVRVEIAPYDGLTSERLVERRALLDHRRAVYRTVKYAWETNLVHVNQKRGDIVGLSHDILRDMYGSGRVASFTVIDGKLADVTLNTDVADLPVVDYDGVFEVKRVFALGEFFALGGPKLGLQVQLPNSAVSVLPIAAVSGRTLVIDGGEDGIEVPAGLRPTLMAAVGSRDCITRRVILATIKPRNDHFAAMEAFDEAPEIFKDLD